LYASSKKIKRDHEKDQVDESSRKTREPFSVNRLEQKTRPSLRFVQRLPNGALRPSTIHKTADMRFERQSDMLSRALDMRVKVQRGFAPAADNAKNRVWGIGSRVW
jgi:hypothetical protein